MKSHPMAFDPSATQGFFVVVEFMGKSSILTGDTPRSWLLKNIRVEKW